MNSETENEAEAEEEAEEEAEDVSMYSETASEMLLSQAEPDETNSETSKGGDGALIELMEEQIYDQNIQIQELKKQIENLKSVLISQFPHYLNAVLNYT